MFRRFLSAPLRTASRISDDSFDGVVLVSHSADKLADYSILKTLSSPILEYLALNKNAEKSASLMKVDSSIIPSGRLIYSGTGEVAKDHYDVRSFTAAARSGMSLAISAGMKSPLLATLPHKKYEQAELVSLIGALQEIYVPLIVREKEDKKKITEFGLIGINTDSQELLSKIEAFEGSFFVCRDIGDTDPQRMTPIRVAEYVEDVFRGTCIKVHVTSDQSVLEREYPLMAAVNRCANSVEDHKARLIWLEYVPDGPIEQTLMLVGKGVTIDTGGANVKVGANMLGMSRDKYGSATVCGFFKALEVLKPKGVKVVGFMCMVRNSIGSNCYTCDEIIESRSGKRVLIGNTDAEGRLAMLDPLTRMVELAVKEKNPHLLTIATLTGHQRSSYGEYATAMDNGPAKQSKFSYSLQEYGDTYGQPIEISRLHPEDFTFNELKYDAAHFRQCNTGAGPAPRGHQTPAALLIQVSGLIDHGTDSTLPIKYTHIDMAGALGDYPCTVFPNPLVALVAGLIIPRV